MNSEYAMHSGKDSIELMINDKENEIKEELFQTLLSRCQIRLQKSMKVVILSLPVLIFCNKKIEYIFKVLNHI